jgi:ABC-2 type transport system permease protein
MTSSTMTPPVRINDHQPPAASFAGIPFTRLLRVEWGKATDTRAARWLLALVAASTVALILVPLLAPASTDQSYTGYLRFAAMGLTILLPVVSILTLTSEWSQRAVLITFTQEPRRIRVVTAKVAVSLLMAGAAAVFGGLVTVAGLGVAAASGRHVDANLSVVVVIGYLLYIVLNVLAGAALGALLHNSAAAITLFFALPAGFLLLGQAWRPIAEWIDSTTTFDWMLKGQWSGHTAQILVTVALWVTIPLSVGIARTIRREIN